MAPIKLQSKLTYADITETLATSGKPDIFVTMTCNPNWHEIQDALLPVQTLQDHPELVAQVFRSKLETMKEMLTKKHVTGVLKADIYVVEF